MLGSRKDSVTEVLQELQLGQRSMGIQAVYLMQAQALRMIAQLRLLELCRDISSIICGEVSV